MPRVDGLPPGVNVDPPRFRDPDETDVSYEATSPTPARLMTLSVDRSTLICFRGTLLVSTACAQPTSH